MSTFAEYMIVAGVENYPPMLDKTMYNSWQSRMLLYLKGKKNGRMMLLSIQSGPLVYPTIEEKSQLRDKKVKLLMQGTELSYQEREYKLYNEFDKITSIKEHLPIQETKLPLKMAGLLFNKFKEDRVRVLMVWELREMLQVQGETMRLVKQGLLSVITIREKMLRVQAHESSQVLDEEQLAFLADPRISDGQAIQKIILQNAAFQIDDLDTYDFDCDDISSAKEVLMANLSSYDSDVLSEPKRNNTRVPRPSGSIENVTDEVVHKEWSDRLVRAATTASSLEAEHDSGEDASKKRRKINDIDADEDITLVNDQDDAKMFDVNDLHGEDVFVEKNVADKEVTDAGEVNAASIATTDSAAATITTEEITLA
nr:hypothetical protein [Tanacetum cinerariifolium]